MQAKSGKRFDLLVMSAWAGIAVTGVFLFSFFQQLAAVNAFDDNLLLEELRRQSKERILEEQGQISSVLESAAAGLDDEAWEEGLKTAARLEGNSQLHLFLARGYRERSLYQPAVSEFRKAVELNRDYTDRRSSFYIGQSLRPFLQEVRNLFLRRGSPAEGGEELRETIRDIFFLQRSLAGGCH